MYITIAGNIGSGKTTLTTMLSKHYGWEASYENIDDNPYIASFYEDMQRWSFNIQIYYLNKRFRQIADSHESKKSVVHDRTIFEDAHIFAPNLHEMGLMPTRDFETYLALYHLISKFIQPPDLLIYLKADVSTLVSQIQKRGRSFENSIRIDYLQSLNERYEKWISEYTAGKLLIIDVNTIKFAESKEDFGTIIDKINGELYGLFNY